MWFDGDTVVRMFSWLSVALCPAFAAILRLRSPGAVEFVYFDVIEDTVEVTVPLIVFWLFSSWMSAPADEDRNIVRRPVPIPTSAT